MQALGAMRYDRAVQALTDLFQYYGKGEPAEAALDALARIAHAASVPLFVQQLTGKSAALRGIAIEGLARIGDPAQIADVQTAAGADRSDTIALAAAFANARLANGSIDRDRRSDRRDRSCAIKRASIWSSSRLGAPRRSAGT